MIFLRPYFLLLLIVPLLFWWIKKVKTKNSAWTAVCDPQLLPYLTVNIKEKRTAFYRILTLMLWCLATIALAGPAIRKPDIQTASMQSGLVVVADMSPILDTPATHQISHKIYDLAEIKEDTDVGLVLTDKNAYTALPLTQDKNILKTISEQIKEQNIMPTTGQNIPAGIDLAAKLLEQSGFEKGQILVFLAGTDNADDLIKKAKQSKYPVFFIGVGNRHAKTPVKLPNGSFWNNGRLYGLEDLEKSEIFTFASADETDLKKILNLKKSEKIQKELFVTEQYQDFGIWLIFLLIPLWALLFRKGALFVILFALLPFSARADLWKRQEQIDYETQTQAIQNFNNKDYEKALNGFSSLATDDTEALYNMANTLAYMGNIEQAIKAYEQVLKQDPSNEDAAYNLEYLKKQQEQQKQQQQDKQSAASAQQKEDKDDSEEQQSNASAQAEKQEKDQEQQNQNNEQNDSESEQQSDETKETQENQQESNEENSENPEEKKQENNGQSSEEQQPLIVPEEDENKNNSSNENKEQQVLLPQDQKQKEWFDKINSDAGRVLRYRLNKQYGAQQ